MITISSPNFWPNRFGNTARFVILHGTAGGTSAANIANWFANPASQVSAHYVVGQDGQIVQCVQEADAAWANGVISGPAGQGGDAIHHDAWWDSAPTWDGVPNPNLNTISIEHVKPSTDNSDALTPAQQAASFTLIKDICRRWNIPMRQADADGGITGHYSMDPANRSRCPGAYPWTALWAQGGLTVGVPQGWNDDGTTLTAPNGIAVVQGFRDYILNNDWEAWNWPVEAEHGQTPLEISDTKLGGGTQQLFRAFPLGWTPASGVIAEWTGPEILALRAKIAELEAEITALKAQVKP